MASCSYCNGYGWTSDHDLMPGYTCPRCNGSGTSIQVPQEVQVDTKDPAKYQKSPEMILTEKSSKGVCPGCTSEEYAGEYGHVCGGKATQTDCAACDYPNADPERYDSPIMVRAIRAEARVKELESQAPADNSVDEDTQRRRDVEASIAIEKVEQQRDHHDRMAQEYFRKWQAAETEVTKLQMQLSDVSRPDYQPDSYDRDLSKRNKK